MTNVQRSRRQVRLSRALGIALTPKAQRIFEKRPYAPGEHGRTRRRTESDYAVRLREKQRLRAQYGVSEKQLRSAYEKATRTAGQTGNAMLTDLEVRLDNLVLRAGIARTTAQARQFVVHRHILVDGNIVDRPSYRVKPGQTIALVGPTGSGKSTLINLICRFYEPTAGEIRIDGVNYKQRSQLWLQSNLGYVLQEPRLFSGTIRDNIRYSKLDATDEEIRRAAQLVNAEPFILKMEKGYDTDVGEGGSRLSTGEKQLISFARAILSNPRIFILDEATSSVDTETEVMIQQAISQVLTGRTSFIIAHRLSTVRSADRILVIEDGKIKEQGTHQQLLRMKGSYYKLYMSQFEEERAQEILSARLADSKTDN